MWGGGEGSCPRIAALPSDWGSWSLLEGNELRGKCAVALVRPDPSRALPGGSGPLVFYF